MGLNQVLRRPLQPPPGRSAVPQIAAMRAYIEREEAVLCDFLVKVKATRATLAEILRALEGTDLSPAERSQLETAYRNIKAKSDQLDTQANMNWMPGSRRSEALRQGRIVLAESGVLLLDPCGLWSTDPAVPVLKSSTVAGARMGDIVLPESMAAKNAVARLEARAWNEAANAAEAVGRFDKAADLRSRAAAIFAAIGAHTPPPAMEATRPSRVISVAPHAIPSGPFGQRISSMANLGVMRFATKAAPLPAPRLGQFSDPASQQMLTYVKDFLAIGMTPYEAFVRLTLNYAPDYLKGKWQMDAFQVNEALRTFERNYSSQQNVSEAAMWGLRDLQDMKADMAFKRMKLAAPEYDEAFLGYYEPFKGGIDAAKVAIMVGLTAALGPVGALSVLVIDPVKQYAETVKRLLDPTDTLFLWYAHVYRMLQIFVPGYAYLLDQQGKDPADLYVNFVVPNLESPAVFDLWVVAANTFVFSRLNAPGVLRRIMSDTQLNQVIEGEKKAIQKGQAELAVLQAIGSNIDTYIDALVLAEWIAKVLAWPIKAAASLPDLGKVDWEKIALYGGIGLGVTGVVGAILWSVFK